MEKIEFKKSIHKWRRRGFYSESVLVKTLEKSGYKAIRVPVSNPSLTPLPDVIARRDLHVYAFEVKTQVITHIFPKGKLRNYSDSSTNLSQFHANTSTQSWLLI